MRKYIFLLIIFISNSVHLPAADITLFTPNRHPVSAFTRAEELSYSERIQCDNYWRMLYPNAEFMGNSTTTYNCHSYAWNIYEGGQTCWLNQYPDLHWYWDDESYVETTADYASRVFYSSGDHSAHSYTSSGLYISKWGVGPRMKHTLTDCPYNTFGIKYYAEYPSISGSAMIGGAEEIEYFVNCIHLNTDLVWNYPSYLFDEVSSTESSIVLRPKSATATGNATVTANFVDAANTVRYTARKNVGINGPHVSGISITVRRDNTGQIVFPSGIGLRQNAYYTVTLSGAEGVDLIEWVADSNIVIDSYSNTEMKFHTGSIPSTLLTVYGTVNRYGVRRNLIGVTLYGGVD